MIELERCKLIKDAITEEYKFDIDLLLEDDSIVFGGIVRDSLIGERLGESKDIDIIVSSESIMALEKKLTELKFVKRDEQFSNYNYLEGINFRTYYKLGDNKRIDLAIPDTEYLFRNALGPERQGVTNDLLRNIETVFNSDLSSSCIGYNKHLGMIINGPNALKMLDRKIFKINRTAAFYNKDQTKSRARKLIERDWIEISF